MNFSACSSHWLKKLSAGQILLCDLYLASQQVGTVCKDMLKIPEDVKDQAGFGK